MVSTLARDQSSRPCSPIRSKTSGWSWSNTPALAHSVSRRQQVAGEPQPSSPAGGSRDGVELRGPCTRWRQSRPGRGWRDAGRRRAGVVGSTARASPAPTARPARGRQQVLSWRGIMPDRPKGAKRRLRTSSRTCVEDAPAQTEGAIMSPGLCRSCRPSPAVRRRGRSRQAPRTLHVSLQRLAWHRANAKHSAGC
jgi:hypothetical protein